MTARLDEEYLAWLYDKVVPDEGNPQYWHLFREMYRTEFVWFIPNDDNRLEDGKELRHEFFTNSRASYDRHWAYLGCSMLELFVALARRLCFEADGTDTYWFWKLLSNTHLDIFDDRYCRNYDYEEAIAEILNTIIWRTYRADGKGGIFPLRHATQDQRGIELWYQLSAYVLELD